MIITITPSLFTFIEKVKSYHVGLTKTTRDIKDALTSLEAIINRVDESPEILITIKDMHRQELLKTKHILLTLISFSKTRNIFIILMLSGKNTNNASKDMK